MFKLCGSLSLQVWPIPISASQLQLVVCGRRWAMKSEHVLVQGLDYAGGWKAQASKIPTRTGKCSDAFFFFYANPSFQNNLFGKLEGLRVSFPLINYIPSRPIIYTPGIPHCIPHYIVVTLLCPPTKTTNIDRIEWFWNGSSWRAQQWKERIMANLRYPETNYVCI